MEVDGPKTTTGLEVIITPVIAKPVTGMVQGVVAAVGIMAEGAGYPDGSEATFLSRADTG
jgi:hypothetical protein